jgi:hypothetical protein
LFVAVRSRGARRLGLGGQYRHSYCCRCARQNRNKPYLHADLALRLALAQGLCQLGIQADGTRKCGAEEHF